MHIPGLHNSGRPLVVGKPFYPGNGKEGNRTHSKQIGWLPNMKWERLNFISNIQYSREGLRVWGAYNIGPGEFIPRRKLNVPDEQDVPSNVSSTIDSNSEVNFAPIKLRRVDIATNLVEEQETIDEDADNASNTSLH